MLLSVSFCVSILPTLKQTFLHASLTCLVPYNYKASFDGCCSSRCHVECFLFWLQVSNHQKHNFGKWDQGNNNSHCANSSPQVRDNGISVVNLNKVLSNGLSVDSALHCFYCLTSVQSSIRIGRSDDETQTQYSKLWTKMKDVVRKVPDDW